MRKTRYRLAPDGKGDRRWPGDFHSFVMECVRLTVKIANELPGCTAKNVDGAYVLRLLVLSSSNQKLMSSAYERGTPPIEIAHRVCSFLKENPKDTEPPRPRRRR